MEKLGLKLPYGGHEGPGVERLTSDHIKLLKGLVEEEHKEFQDWMEALDESLQLVRKSNGEFGHDAVLESWSKVIDGMCDIIVTVHNTSNAMNIDLEPYFNEIHRTNMEKADGPMREDGKRLKPEGWEEPDIRGMLEDELRRYENQKDIKECYVKYKPMFTASPVVALIYELARDYLYTTTVEKMIADQYPVSNEDGSRSRGWFLTDKRLAEFAVRMCNELEIQEKMVLGTLRRWVERCEERKRDETVPRGCDKGFESKSV